MLFSLFRARLDLSLDKSGTLIIHLFSRLELHDLA